MDYLFVFQLFTDCHLVDRVLGAWDANDNQEAEPGFKRKGYMGHLTRIANVMVIIMWVCYGIFEMKFSKSF